ncbi:MAG: hypothetical protein ACE5K9_10805, partial [Candidatus Methylomirabilales bacterium]
QPILEIQAALTDPDQVRTLLDLARSGDKDQFVELARCLGVPADRVESLWEGTVRRLRSIDFSIDFPYTLRVKTPQC